MATGWVSTYRGRHLRARRNKDTEPEVLLRRILYASGLRYRIHMAVAGSTADIVFPRQRVAIFVDGDFWHGCPIHHPADKFGGPNAVRWRDKIARTRARDAAATDAAQRAGWRVLRIWECEIRADPVASANRVAELVCQSKEP